MVPWLDLPTDTAVLVCAIAFLAGLVRGFAGFGLSALAMAALATVIPPIELIPIFWFLEMAASLLLMKGGWADADRRVAILLTVTAILGLPLGLLISLNINTQVSRLLALGVLILLGVAQLFRIRLALLERPNGTALTGLTAGIVTGISGAGGMVIALYALARSLPPRMMRGTLNIYLLGAGAMGPVTHILMGTMTEQAAMRGAVLVMPCLLGVLIGRALFTPRWEPYYKPFCLVLLLSLCTLSLARTLLQMIWT